MAGNELTMRYITKENNPRMSDKEIADYNRDIRVLEIRGCIGPDGQMGCKSSGGPCSNHHHLCMKHGGPYLEH